MISVFPKEGAADICQHTTIIFLGFPTEQHRSVMCEEKMLFISQFFWSVSLNVNSVVTKPTFSPESGTDGRLTEDNNICWWGVMRKFLSGKNTWPVSVSTAAGEMWQTRSRCLFPQAPSPTYQGLFPSTRRYAHADVREPSWRWSAIFTPPGVSRNTTSVTAGGWETAACGFLSATPGSAAEASPRRGCARLGSQTRRRISTGLTATGSPEWKQTKEQMHFLCQCLDRDVSPGPEFMTVFTTAWSINEQENLRSEATAMTDRLIIRLYSIFSNWISHSERAFIENRDFWVYCKVKRLQFLVTWWREKMLRTTLDCR